MLSYWEKSSFLQYDYIIIGAGIVGLSTALSIREQIPAASILVLERGILPTGASTKNAGFACIGSLTEILDDLKTMPEEKVVELVSLRLKGLARLRHRLGDHNMGYEERGSFELISDRETLALDQIDRVNKLLCPLLQTDAFQRCDYKRDEFGFNPNQIKHLIENTCEGELHSGRMMRALLRLCAYQQIEIKTGADVLRIEEETTQVNIIVRHQQLHEEITFTATKVAICTNAFASHLVSGLDIQPGRGQVLITKPIANLRIKGVFHFDAGYYYFREIDGRILFGGGRHLDFEGEQTDLFAYNQYILNDLRYQLDTIILPQTPYEVDYSWTGIMAFGKDKFPIIRQQTDRTFIAVRMGGMGVAIGSEAGHQLAALICV